MTPYFGLLFGLCTGLLAAIAIQSSLAKMN